MNEQSNYGAETAGHPQASQPVEPLTEREEETLLALAQGQTNSEIAEGLYISLSTVKTHVTNLLTKVEARNRVELAIWAHETGRMT